MGNVIRSWRLYATIVYFVFVASSTSMLRR